MKRNSIKCDTYSWNSWGVGKLLLFQECISS